MHPSCALQCALPFFCKQAFLFVANQPSHRPAVTKPCVKWLLLHHPSYHLQNTLPSCCKQAFLFVANQPSYLLQHTLPSCCKQAFLLGARDFLLPPRRPKLDICCHALRDLQEGWVPVSVLPSAWTWRSNRGDGSMRHDVSARQAATEEERSFKKRRAHGEG